MDITKLRKLKACNEALNWAALQRSRQQAWDDCPRGDWMLWLLGRRIKRQGSVAHRRLVLCCCAVAEATLAYIPDGEDRPRLAIEAAARWARREGVTVADLRSAAAAAADAHADYSAGAYAANAAKAAAANAANAANAAFAVAANAAAANVAAHAAHVAYADAHEDAVRHGYSSMKAAGAAYAAAANARRRSRLRSADIVRRHYPRAPRF